MNWLLVEDNPADRVLLATALKGEPAPPELFTVENVAEALDFLYRRGEFADAPRPHLILLDLNLPGGDGRVLLKQIKNDSALRGIPVVMLTTSDAASDVRSCYDLHANAYLVKPVGLTPLRELLAGVRSFWERSVADPVELAVG